MASVCSNRYNLYSSYVGLTREQISVLSSSYSEYLFGGYLDFLMSNDLYFDLLRYYVFISTDIDSQVMSLIQDNFDLVLSGGNMTESDVELFLSSLTDDLNRCRFGVGDLVSVHGYQNCVFRINSVDSGSVVLDMCLKDIFHLVFVPAGSLVEPLQDLEYTRDLPVFKGTILFDIGYVLSRVGGSFDLFLRFLFKYKTIFMNYTTVFYLHGGVVLPDWWVEFISLFPVPVVDVVFRCDIFVSNRRYFLSDLVVITEDSVGILPFEFSDSDLQFERVFSALLFVTDNVVSRDSLYSDFSVFGLDYLLNERLSRFKSSIEGFLCYDLVDMSFRSHVDIRIKDFSRFCYNMGVLWIFNNFMSNVSRLVR